MNFDYCIVDEASQVSEASIVGPLLFAEKFVLVGDHFQLPPLVLSKDAENKGMGVSLFQKLSRSSPDAVVGLSLQYRMNRDINLIPSSLFYDKKLKCATKEVAENTLNISEASLLRIKPSVPYWIYHAVRPANSVVFLDTSNISCRERRTNDDLVVNEEEARMVFKILTTLMELGVSQDEIGIISPYAAQIFTVDKFQGRDKSVVILTFVRSNDEHSVGELLVKWRRLNVALTRSKQKLLMIGDIKTLRSSPYFANLIDLLRANGFIFEITSKY